MELLEFILWAIVVGIMLDRFCLDGLFTDAIADRIRGRKKDEEE